MTTSFDACMSRLDQLDAQMRAHDSSWVGLGASSRGLTWANGASFADQLSAASATAAAATPNAAATATAGATASSATFVSPLPSGRVTQSFGPSSLSLEPATTINGVHYDHFHRGLDLAAGLGTPVTAAAAGTVTYAARRADGAVVVMVRHDDGSVATYGHLQPDLDVAVGDRVALGEQLGKVGMTGKTTGPHLHFELSVDGTPVDPADWLKSGHLPRETASAGANATSSGTETATGRAAFDTVASEIPYAAEIRAAAVAAGVDPLLLASLVRAESGFRATAVSSCGAQGLAQLMPATAKSLGVTNAFDPAQNVTAAARYFANNLHLYGRTDVALAAYQAGKGAVAAAGGGIPSSPTTRNYISRILGYWSSYLTEASR